MKEVPSCPVEATLSLISNKWKTLILYHLNDGTMRFNELRRSVHGISQKVLTHNLRELEQDGLIHRTIYAEVPPRVEYSLTKLGKSLQRVIDSMSEWGREYQSSIQKSREA